MRMMALGLFCVQIACKPPLMEPAQAPKAARGRTVFLEQPHVIEYRETGPMFWGERVSADELRVELGKELVKAGLAVTNDRDQAEFIGQTDVRVDRRVGVLIFTLSAHDFVIDRHMTRYVVTEEFTSLEYSDVAAALVSSDRFADYVNKNPR